MSRPTLDPSAVAAAVARHLGEPATIDGLRRLSGGASRESWSFDVVRADGARDGLVLRRDPGGYIGPTDRSTEYELLRAAGAGGVPVPRVRFVLEAADDLGAGFVMDRVEGETIARKILRDDEYAAARPVMARQCGEIAARIHALPEASLPALAAQSALDQVEQFRGYLDAFGEPHPAFELGLRWLTERASSAETGTEPSATTLVHGDFRNGNFVVGPEGIRAVLDWELAHRGDPIEDLGWLCVKSWRFGVDDRPAGGFGSYEDLVTAYEESGGIPVDPDRLRYWEAFGTLKWGVMCEIQCFTHLHGMVRSVELAVLGRRVAEMEWDLLELIG
jgi:aminoglycoside phosphotransferase (APT) family kinase protein